MTPVDKYTFRKDIRAGGNGSPVSYFPKTTLTDLTQGELVAWNTTDKNLVRYVEDGSAGDLAGITRDSQTGMAKLGNQTPLADFVGRVGLVSVFTSGVHLLKGKAGDTYKHGDVVQMNGTDTQSVTLIGAGIRIGIVFLPDGSTVSGAVDVPILIDGSVFFVGGPEMVA